MKLKLKVEVEVEVHVNDEDPFGNDPGWWADTGIPNLLLGNDDLWGMAEQEREIDYARGKVISAAPLTPEDEAKAEAQMEMNARVGGDPQVLLALNDDELRAAIGARFRRSRYLVAFGECSSPSRTASVGNRKARRLAAKEAKKATKATRLA